MKCREAHYMKYSKTIWKHKNMYTGIQTRIICMFSVILVPANAFNYEL